MIPAATNQLVACSQVIHAFSEDSVLLSHPDPPEEFPVTNEPEVEPIVPETEPPFAPEVAPDSAPEIHPETDPEIPSRKSE